MLVTIRSILIPIIPSVSSRRPCVPAVCTVARVAGPCSCGGSGSRAIAPSPVTGVVRAVGSCVCPCARSVASKTCVRAGSRKRRARMALETLAV